MYFKYHLSSYCHHIVVNTHVPGVLQVVQKYLRVNNNHFQRTVKTVLTSTEIYWQAAFAILTLAGYLESFMILPTAVNDATYGDTQIPQPEPCYRRDPQMRSPCPGELPNQERRCGEAGQMPL